MANRRPVFQPGADPKAQKRIKIEPGSKGYHVSQEGRGRQKPVKEEPIAQIGAEGEQSLPIKKAPNVQSVFPRLPKQSVKLSPAQKEHARTGSLEVFERRQENLQRNRDNEYQQYIRAQEDYAVIFRPTVGTFDEKDMTLLGDAARWARDHGNLKAMTRLKLHLVAKKYFKMIDSKDVQTAFRLPSFKKVDKTIKSEQLRILDYLARSRGNVNTDVINDIFKILGTPIKKYDLYINGIDKFSESKQKVLKDYDNKLAVVKAQMHYAKRKKRSLERKGGKLLAISRRKEGQTEVPAQSDLPPSEGEREPKRRRKTKPSARPAMPPSFSMQHGEAFRRGNE